MYEGNSFLGGPDFSSLAEVPPPSPEKKPDDDDDDLEEDPKPKTLMDFLKKDPEESKEEKPEESDEKTKETEESDEKAEDEEPEIETDPAEDAEEVSDSQEMTGEEEQLAAAQIIKEREEAVRAEVDEAKTAEAEKEALAAGVFLDKAKEEVEDGQPVAVALDNAKAKALESLGIEQPEADEEPEVEITPAAPETVEIPEPIEPEEPEATPVAPIPTAVGGGTTPPPPPIVPAGGLPHMPLGGGGSGGNVLPPTPNLLPDTEDQSGRRVNTGGAVLAGGLVGYMIGRRRGRIKTEKKLLPIQHKLEKELADLQDKIAWHEASVRSLVHEQVSKTPEPAEQKTEHLKTAKEHKDAKAEHEAESTTSQNHSERLGKFAMVTERPSQPEANRTPEQLKPIDLMTVPELLVLAERIEIEQSTVRKLYEAKRLNYEGLRRIIRAYLRGERYDQLVRDNLLSPEKYAYPEMLQTINTGAMQVGSSLPGQTNTVDPSNPPGQFGATPPPANPWQAPNQIVPDQKTNVPQKGIIVAGIILAVLLLIFIVAR